MLFWIRTSAKRTRMLQRSAGQSYRGIGIAPPYSGATMRTLAWDLQLVCDLQKELHGPKS